MKLVFVIGIRPDWIRCSQLIVELKAKLKNNFILVHTGQHYSDNLDKNIREQLNLPHPDYHFVSGFEAKNEFHVMAKIMTQFADLLDEVKPDMLVRGRKNEQT